MRRKRDVEKCAGDFDERRLISPTIDLPIRAVQLNHGAVSHATSGIQPPAKGHLGLKKTWYTLIRAITTKTSRTTRSTIFLILEIREEEKGS